MFNRKGQITVFMILGILILLVSAIIFYLTSISADNLELEIEEEFEIRTPKDQLMFHVESCIDKVTIDLVKKMSENGGTLNIDNENSIIYQSQNYRYLCEDIPGKNCENLLLSKEEMQNELANGIEKDIGNCINLSFLSNQGFNVNKKNYTATTIIAQNQILVSLNFPVKLTKDQSTILVENFVSDVNIPLGKAYNLIVDILNNEIQENHFNKDKWMYDNGLEIFVYKNKPYPDIIYKLIKSFAENDNLTFNFAVEGKDRVTTSNYYVKETYSFGCCMVDNYCFKNVKESRCKEVKGNYNSNKNCQCEDFYVAEKELCNGQPCKSCTDTYNYLKNDYSGKKREHGESWCVYDSIVKSKVKGTTGLSYVGSRHYKVSCINGEEIIEECRDYREELCTEKEIDGKNKAVCKSNRWSDCAKCTTEECCSNSELRDCQWSSWLSSDQKCHPIVPPGLKFWEGIGLDVCMQATEYKECKGFSCPQKWTDDTAINCYFQGDCGNYRNIADMITVNGFFSTDPMDYPQRYIYLEDGLNHNPKNINGKSLNIDLDKNKQVNLISDSKETTFQQLPILLSVGMNYLNYLSKLSLGDYINPFTPEPEVKILDYAICGLWSAPTINKCELCEDENKLCSEYRCKSLGTDCEFEYVDGWGKCYRNNIDDDIAPTIVVDKESFEDKYSVS